MNADQDANNIQNTYDIRTAAGVRGRDLHQQENHARHPCFNGSHLPVQTLMDFLETGETIDEFLAVYPYIPLEQVVAFLEIGRDLAIDQLSCAST